MRILRRFWRHDGGSSFESLALILSVIAVLCVAGADLLHYSAQKNSVLAQVFSSFGIKGPQAGGRPPALRGGIDYMPTASIAGMRHVVKLSPCTGKAK